MIKFKKIFITILLFASCLNLAQQEQKQEVKIKKKSKAITRAPNGPIVRGPLASKVNRLPKFDNTTGSSISSSEVTLQGRDLLNVRRLNAQIVNADTLNGTATRANNFNGTLDGDISGTQKNTVVQTVGGQTAANIAQASAAANAATNLNNAGTIVRRDISGNFITNKVTLTGAISNATDATTKEYVDNVSGGFAIKDPAVATSSSNITIFGLQTIDGVSLSVNDRVLLTGQTNSIQNGLWLVQTTDWIRPTDFAAGTPAGNAYVLVTMGNTQQGTSWLCSTPTAIIDTNSTEFILFSLGQSSMANVGSGNGQVFKNKTGTTFNLKTIAAGDHVTVNDNLSDIGIFTDATSGNTASTIVARDASGNFSANVISANLSGNAATATTATNLSGPLSGDVTGTQSSTTVALVGGQTASSVGAASVLANAATDVNTASTIVKRNASGNFSAGTITANLTGSASSNVLKSGDSMTGNLNMAAQSELRLQDASGGEYIGLRAPTSVAASYTVNLPGSAPSSNQVLSSNGSGTNLQWTTTGDNVLPANNKIIYVAKYGNDSTGNGSTTYPYLTLSKAITEANLISSSSNPITIEVAPGIYIEDNSVAPLAITASSITIAGSSTTSTIIRPNTLSNNLISVSASSRFTNLSFESGGVSTAAGVNILGGTVSFATCIFRAFNTGLLCSSGSSIFLNSCFFLLNTTGINNNNLVIIASDCFFQAALGASTGVSSTGSNGLLSFNGGVYTTIGTAFSISSNSVLTAEGGAFRTNTNGININNGGKLVALSCSFETNPGVGTVTNIQVSGTGSEAKINACSFDQSSLAVNDLTALKVTDSAVCNISSSIIKNYKNALILGISSDTSSTQLTAAGLLINNCTNDIIQDGTSTLNFNTGTADSAKITINDSTNVNLSYFDPSDNNTLQIGSFSDENTKLIGASIGASENPQIDYHSNVYNTQAIGYFNTGGNPATFFSLSDSDANLSAVTTDRSKCAKLRLASDEGSTFGGTTALRSWDVCKNETTAELAFKYQNSDTSGQSVVSDHTVMQLDGLNNQIQLPTAGTQITFSDDTNLYRSAANTLKTDDNLIIDGLTVSRAIATNSNKQLVSSATTDTELGFLSGVTSAVQTQLNNKVSKSGDTMSGALQLPAGTTALPSLNFTGSTTTGLSTSSNNLSFSTNASERMKISSAGVVSINNLSTAGVVHNDVSGNLTTSTIVNADIAAAANIADTKLATIATAGKVSNSATTATSANSANAIVSRDSNGDFSASTITANVIGNLTGNADTATTATSATSATTATTATNFSGSLSGDVTGTQGSTVVSTVGGQSAANIAAATILANAATNNDTASAIVRRDASKNFATNMITINGTVTNPTDVATKEYVDNVAATGLEAKEPAIVVSTSNVALTGLQTIDGVVLVDGNRVLLVAQSNAVENGLWVAHSGAWTRPTDFNTGDTAGQAYVLITSGTVNAGSSWLCSTPTAIIDTDSITFAQFSNPSQTTAANVGAGAGQIFRDKTGQTINLKTIAAGTHVTVTNNTNDITLSTDATDSNSASAIVARDASGNFSAGTITANLTGSASNNVLKSGDSMTGNLNMQAQSELRLQDASGGEYVGLRAPSTVSASYTVNLPGSAPTAHQVLAANSTPTNLLWITPGSNVLPASSKIIYVSKYGNDSTGNGSSTFPYLTLSKAITEANLISTASNPIAIQISPGIYVEDNSVAPLAITAAGITIYGASQTAVIVRPNTLSNNLITTNVSTRFHNMSFESGGVSTASGITLLGGTATLITCLVRSFNIGINCTSGSSCILNSCFLLTNSTAINNNNLVVLANNCTIQGAGSGTGISSTGSNGSVLFANGICSTYATGFAFSNNSQLNLQGTAVRTNTVGVSLTSGGKLTAQSAAFELNSTSGTITNIQASGAGSDAQIVGCTFNQAALGSNELTAVQVTDSATCNISGGEIKNYKNALIIGASSDTSSTQMKAASLLINNCTNDIIQDGTSTLEFNTGTASGSKITINDSTNVNLSYFDPSDNNTLQIGSFSDEDTKLIGASIGASENPQIDYRSNVYNTQAIGYFNTVGNPATFFSLSDSDANLSAVTTDRSKCAKLRLASDEGSTFGGTTALRSWDVCKNETTAELAFKYQNSDTSGQSAVSDHTVMQLDGLNNQLQLPTADTQITFSGDTNLYRSAANTLKTDDNLIIDGLTASRAIATNSSKQLVSSATTDTELGFLSGVTSAVQTQLNNKVSKSGDTMSGALQLPAGTTALPSLNFTGSTTTGLSTSSNNLSFSTSASERMKISSAGVVSINNLSTAGVVHNDVSGNLTTSTIVNADIAAAANIADTKLATIATAGKVSNSATTATSANSANAIVSRDSNGDFSASTITANVIGNLTGNADTATTATSATSATTATTATNFSGSLSGDVTGTQGSTVVSTVGGQTAVNIAAATILANAATNLNNSNAIVKRDASGNFSAGTITATLSGNASTATTATTATNFSGSLSGDVTGTQGATVVSNVGGQTAANVAAGAVLANAATNVNNNNAIVKRDASGNFAASTITAALNGNASTATTAGSATNFSGSLSGDVTGTQGATSVALVGGQTAANVAAGAVLANNSTSANTASQIVRRDGSGNFSAGTITANLSGNATSATSATSATTAGSATNFSGSLSGDVTGTQGATSVALVGGQTAANVAAGAVLANNSTSANTASQIVRRDGSGNFSAGTLTANLTGNVTGSASLNVLKSGDTMTGNLTHPAGSAAAPSINFTGSTTTGLSAATADTLSFDTAGVERMNISSTAINSIAKFVLMNLLCNQAIQTASPAAGATVTVLANTSVLILTPAGNLGSLTITLPSTGLTNGQMLTVSCTVNINTLTFNGGTTFSMPTAFTASVRSVSLIYYSTNNAWYRIA